jgi:hypothetical protein
MPSRWSLLQELLDESVRARRRRLRITTQREARLLALGTVDAKLERNLRAMAVFQEEALEVCSAHLAGCHHPQEIDALVHATAACAVQLRDPTARDRRLAAWLEIHIGNHRTALRDALWFHPSGIGSISPVPEHVAALLDSPCKEIRLLGIELAGRLDDRSSQPRLTAWMRDARDDEQACRAIELALCRLGHPPKGMARRVRGLIHGSAEDQLHALRMIALSGQAPLLPAEAYLHLAATSHPTLASLAWCLSAIADPIAAHDLAMARDDLDADLRTRVLALAGFPQGSIAVLTHILTSHHPATPAQLDALACFLGAIPMEMQAHSVDAGQRETAAREALLRVFRAAHVPIHNDADRCAWAAEAIVSEGDLRRLPRLRFGHALPTAPRRVALSAALHRMTPSMCQALYLEQAALAGTAFAHGLSWYAAARVQMNAIGLSERLGGHAA